MKIMHWRHICTCLNSTANENEYNLFKYMNLYLFLHHHPVSAHFIFTIHMSIYGYILREFYQNFLKFMPQGQSYNFQKGFLTENDK